MRFDPVTAVSELVHGAAVDALGAEYADIEPLVRRSDRADLQADLALGLAKRTGQQPRVVADAIAAKVSTGDVIDRVEVAGPGFLNITLRGQWLAEGAMAMRRGERLEVPLASSPERVVIDYSHPNVAKEMHVGHLRSTVIGDALARLLEWRGHTVIRQNHIGDWGTPFGMLIEHFVDVGEAAEKELVLGELATFYKTARKKFDEDLSFADRARARVVRLQSGDAETLGWWRRLVELSARYFQTVYEKLDVTLRPSDICGESFYNDRLAPLAKELESSGYAKISDGALCVFPEGFRNKEGQPLPLIVRKSDGGYGYMTTDLAAIRYRLQELGATCLLYVVGAPQSQHFAMVFKAASELGWLAPPARAQHVAFGSVLGTDKKMFKTRAGDTVRLIDLIDAAIDRADAVIAAKAPNLSAAERAPIAKTVGVGAIKYADLSSDRIKDYVFDVDRMVSFDGQTAGYAQYAHARAQSVLRNAGDNPSTGSVIVAEPAERRLVLELLGFADAVLLVEESLQPHKLATYVYDVATAFTGFYEACPILKAAPAVRASRLALTDLTAKTLARALGLLGIGAVDRM